MDLSVSSIDPISRIAIEKTSNDTMDRHEHSSKADRLDMIVGDVLARQCKTTIIDNHLNASSIIPLSGDLRFISDQHHHQELNDETSPTEADVPLHEWISALTHPLLGPYPNGVTPRILDRLASEAGVVRFPDHARRRWHKIWSSSNHLCVYLSDEVKSGRLRRVRFGHYAGCFDNHLACSQVNYKSTGIENETNGEERFSLEATHMDGHGDTAKDETDFCNGTTEASHFSIGTARAFPIVSLSDDIMRDRTSSSESSRRRTYRSTFSNEDELYIDDSSPKNGKINHVKRQKTKDRRNGMAIDEFGLPSLLEDPSFANVVLSLGINVQSWTVDQSATFLQDFGFKDGAEAFIREEIDGTALMLLKRVDVMDGLRLKIGPAVKLYRYVKALQKLASKCNIASLTNGYA